MSSAAEPLLGALSLEPAQLSLVLGVVAAILAGTVVQSAVGFGMGLVSVTTMLWLGLELPQAVCLMLGGALLQCGYGLYLGREHIDRRLSLGMALFQYLGVIAGVMSMAWLVSTGAAVVKQVVGLFILIALVVQLSFRPTPRERYGFGLSALVGLISGYLGGLVGIGGPPLMLYALAHSWERDRTRVFMWAQFFLVIPVIAAALVLRFGPELLAWLAGGFALLPVLVLGTRIGLRLTQRWSAEQLRKFAIVLLLLISVSSIASPWLSAS